MYLLGLTGSIGMGKSAAAARFRHNGVPVFDADQAVHDLYAGTAVPLIAREFPGATNATGVDRDKLSKILQDKPELFPRLEAIVHPLVRALEADFLVEQDAAGATLVVLEVPLLYETGFEKLLDGVAVVSAPAAVQAERVLARPGMTPEKLETLLARQLPDGEKRRRADFIVDTSGTLAQTEAQVDKLTALLRAMPGLAFARHWQ
jgi:dephospho-CoA kinase